MKLNLIPCWMALASAKGMSNKRKVEFLIDVVHEKTPLDEAFQAIKKGDRLGFTFSDKEWEGMVAAAAEIPNNSFVAERLVAGGIETIHIMDKYVYPKSLKDNLKKDAPIVIYAKGNLDLIKRPMVAIVGARSAGERSLQFTDNIAKKAVREKKVVVSGFAKGVDKRALDATLEFGGQSVIVLPQGIETYRSKDYYQALVNGNVLVISTYHPKAAWSVGLAMDRNKIIYGLANEIYAAESNDSGGTWEGVREGLKRGRTVYVRQPEAREKNANQLLIDQGAVSVDFEGNPISGLQRGSQPYPDQAYKPMILSEPISDGYAGKRQGLDANSLVEMIIESLQVVQPDGLTVMDLIRVLKLGNEWKEKLPRILDRQPTVRKEKRGKYNHYFLDDRVAPQGRLF